MCANGIYLGMFFQVIIRSHFPGDDMSWIEPQNLPDETLFGLTLVFFCSFFTFPKSSAIADQPC